jgi:uncharacterized protein (TIGR03435 family)
MKPAEKPAASSSSEMVGGGLSLIKDRSGEPELSPGRHGKLVIPLSDGRSRQSGRMQTITEIIEMCARELGQPVVDGTGLQGAYDYNIDFARSPDDPAEPKPDSETPFLTAFQGQLGLRLEPKKVPVSVVVIDHIEKKPAEN